MSRSQPIFNGAISGVFSFRPVDRRYRQIPVPEIAPGYFKTVDIALGYPATLVK
jgi:hypothetical protein